MTEKKPVSNKKIQKLMNELLDEIVQVYTVDCNHNLNDTADQVEMSTSKVRKLLITAGERDGIAYFTSDTSETILDMYHQDKSVEEIMQATGLGYHSVSGYLPYTKTIYKLSELSSEATRLRRCRHRKSLCNNYTNAILGMSDKAEEEYLWKTLSEVSGRIFHTVGKGSIKFTYTINDEEMLINKEDKSISRASVITAYHKAKKMGIVKSPKMIGTSGANFLYPIFLEIKICKAE